MSVQMINKIKPYNKRPRDKNVFSIGYCSEFNCIKCSLAAVVWYVKNIKKTQFTGGAY